MNGNSTRKERKIMHRRGRRGILLALCAVCLLSLLPGCIPGPGRDDWRYDLPGQYAVFRVNSGCIEIVYLEFENGGPVVVDNYVSAFCCNERYVGVRRIVPDDRRHCTVQEQYEKEPAYYIIDTEKPVDSVTCGEAVFGPFDEAGFKQQCGVLDVGDCGEWISTYPAPDGAGYDGNAG